MKVKTEYFYYAVQEDDENGRHIAHVRRLADCYNLLHAFKGRPIIVMPCKTKKRAEEIANFWNECSLKNGNYLFQESGHVFPAVCIEGV